MHPTFIEFPAVLRNKSPVLRGGQVGAQEFKRALIASPLQANFLRETHRSNHLSDRISRHATFGSRLRGDLDPQRTWQVPNARKRIARLRNVR